MRNLLLNSLVELEFSGEIIRKRILWLNDANVVSINVDDKQALPVWENSNQFFTELKEKGVCILLYRKTQSMKLEKQLKEYERLLRNTAFNVIKPLVSMDNVPNIYIPDIRERLIADISQEKRLSKHTIYKYLRRYWQWGINGLLPVLDNVLVGRNVTKRKK